MDEPGEPRVNDPVEPAGASPAPEAAGPGEPASLDETLPVLISSNPADVRETVRMTISPGASLDETLPVVPLAAARPATPPGGRSAVEAATGGARDAAPPGGTWRGDALAASPHGRLAELLAAPAEDFDSERAAGLCADVCREALGDFAPALVLLPVAERRRAQAVAAFALTLFDFARQRGVDGERLAQINRWEYTLEAALSGDRIGQPVFLRMGEEEQRRPFSRDGLDALFAAARRRATCDRPIHAAEAETARRQLAEGLVQILLGDGQSPAALEFASGLLGLRALLGLGAELAGGRCPLPVDELPAIVPAPPPDRLSAALDAEIQRLEPLLLRGARAVREVPLTFRRPTAYLVLAAERLLARAGAVGARLVAKPPRLGAFERLRLVARARWGSLARG